MGNPLRFKLTPGNLSDVGELPGLIKGMSAKALLADKGYDSNAVVELALAGGMEAWRQSFHPGATANWPARWTWRDTLHAILSKTFFNA